MLKGEWLNWETYRKKINEIPNIKNLISSPFILNMLVQILLNTQKKILTMTDIFEAFSEMVFERELCKKYENIADSKVLVKQAEEYNRHAMRIASLMMADGKTFVGRDWEHYQEFFNIHDQRLMMLYKGILMQKVGETYSFIHKTVLEYFSVLSGICEVN